MVARARVAVAVLVAVLVPLLGGRGALAKEKDPIPRAKKGPEFQYLDAEDEAEAQALLPKVVARYPGAAGALKLRDLLAKKRPYPARVPDRLTFERTGPDGKARQVTWIAPARYAKGKPTGVLFFLHGAVRQPAPGGGANEAGMFAPAVKDLDLIVVGPSTYDGVEWGSPACRDLFHHALRVVKQTFNVDENRVYLAGDSDGGRGAYNIVETEATFLAAAVPVIGSPGGVTRFANLRNLPFFAINGEKDSIFDVAHVREAVKGMQAAGIDLLYKEIAGGGHDPRYFLTYQDDVCRFLRDHPRVPHPAVVAWQVDAGRGDHGGGFPGDTFRWIRIDETGATRSQGAFEDASGSLVRGDLPRIEARRTGNRIEVTTRSVRRYSVLVSPDVLDLGQEIEVVTNGSPSFRGTVEPDAAVVLEEARRFLDRQLLYVARIAVDVDAAPSPPAGDEGD